MPKLSSIPQLKAGEPAKELFFIGNSYTISSNLAHMVGVFMRERGIESTVRRSLVGGATFEEHWNGKRGLKTRERMKERPYDYMIFQANSRAALDQYDETIEYGEKLVAEGRALGAFPLLYETWARQDCLESQEKISTLYRELAEKNQAVVLPVGQAWKRAREERPDLPLFTADGHHPMAVGTLLAACVMFEALTGQDSAGLPNEPCFIDQNGEFIVLAYIDPEHAAFCQRIAHETILAAR